MAGLRTSIPRVVKVGGTMHTDWIWGFGGGLMIGLAAAGYLLMNGKIMGISGIFGGLLDGTGWANWPERLAFVASLIGVPWLMTLATPANPGSGTHITGNWLVIVAGGLLVGLGTRLANGCTSGHGVCGMSRLSLRGIAATVFYVLAGGLTMALLRHVLGVI
jgi:uncharacterized membrane protein YedE/YeeE